MSANWSDVGTAIAKYAPLLGAAVAGNPGPAILAIIAQAFGCETDAKSISSAIQNDPDAFAKLAQIEANAKIELQRLAVSVEIASINAAAAQIESYNKTLQTEAMGGSWLQRNHHAIESLATVALIMAVYFVLPMTGHAVPAIPESAFITLGALLGVTAWQRGAANVATAKAGAQ